MRRRPWVFPVVTLGAVLFIWYGVALLLHAVNDVSANKLPYPHEVVATYFRFPQTFAEATWATGSRAVLGFLAGLLIALVFGIVMIQSRWIESV